MNSNVEHCPFYRSDPSKKGIFCVDDDLVQIVVNASEANLLDLAAIYQEPLSDDEIELFLFICDTLALKGWSDEYMDQAKQMAEDWLTQVESEHPDYCRRQQLFASVV